MTKVEKIEQAVAIARKANAKSFSFLLFPPARGGLSKESTIKRRYRRCCRIRAASLKATHDMFLLVGSSKETTDKLMQSYYEALKDARVGL